MSKALQWLLAAGFIGSLFGRQRSEEMKSKVLVAKCLSGAACRYHGEGVAPRARLLARLREDHRIVYVCPEQLAGLPTPRPAARWRGGRLIAAGQDVTELFQAGAEKALAIAQDAGAARFYGLRNSPSCDPKNGITCRLLTAAGIKCIAG
jgi:uncharacterized protein YbbK (DUF523 family)